MENKLDKIVGDYQYIMLQWGNRPENRRIVGSGEWEVGSGKWENESKVEGYSKILVASV
jgi:hypothetical protein